jgi:hypothetical protein
MANRQGQRDDADATRGRTDSRANLTRSADARVARTAPTWPVINPNGA